MKEKIKEGKPLFVVCQRDFSFIIFRLCAGAWKLSADETFVEMTDCSYQVSMVLREDNKIRPTVGSTWCIDSVSHNKYRALDLVVEAVKEWSHDDLEFYGSRVFYDIYCQLRDKLDALEEGGKYD